MRALRRLGSRATRGRALLVAGAALALLGARAPAQWTTAGWSGSAGGRPFAAGENLTYRVSTGIGRVGTASMTVGAPEELRGRDVLRLRFRLRARVGFVVVADSTVSWLDPAEMASLRYFHTERSPISRATESVEIFPGERRWTESDGTTGTSATAAPLDELSFLYYLRTLPLADGDVYTLERHFDPERNPVEVRVLRRESWTGPAGTFPTVVVQMRVKDASHYKGKGALRLFLTDDARRLPVRIETAMPVAGTLVLSLESGA
jgi:hypothetical protein